MTRNETIDMLIRCVEKAKHFIQNGEPFSDPKVPGVAIPTSCLIDAEMLVAALEAERPCGAHIMSNSTCANPKPCPLHDKELPKAKDMPDIPTPNSCNLGEDCESCQ